MKVADSNRVVQPEPRDVFISKYRNSPITFGALFDIVDELEVQLDLAEDHLEELQEFEPSSGNIELLEVKIDTLTDVLDIVFEAMREQLAKLLTSHHH